MPGTEATIRPFEPADHASARKLWERCEGVELSAADEPQAFRGFLERNPGFSYVAIVDGALAGTILCGHDGRRGLIHHLAVAPEHRRHGIARALVQRSLASLRACGIHKCHLLVVRGNADGIAFWRRIGAEERTTLALFSMMTQAP